MGRYHSQESLEAVAEALARQWNSRDGKCIYPRNSTAQNWIDSGDAGAALVASRQPVSGGGDALVVLRRRIQDEIEALEDAVEGAPPSKDDPTAALARDVAWELRDALAASSRVPADGEEGPACDCGHAGTPEDKHRNTCTRGRWLLLMDAGLLPADGEQPADGLGDRQLTAEEADVAASLLEATPEGTMSGAWETARVKLRRLASGENPDS